MKGCIFQGKGEGKRLCTVGRQADDEKEASAMKKGNHHCKKAGEKGRWNDGEITLNEGIKKKGISTGSQHLSRGVFIWGSS